MKTLLLFLLSSCSAFAQLNISNPFYVATVTRNVAGAASNLTVDLWQTFESTLDAGGLAATDNTVLSVTWTVTGVGKSMNASAQQTMLSTVNTVSDTGTQGMVVDNNTGSGSIQLEITGGGTSETIGFWLNVTALTDATETIVYAAGETATADSIVQVSTKRSGSTYTLHIDNTTAESSTITISAATWYWVTAKVVRNGTCLLRVYSTSGTQVGSEVSVTGQLKSFFYHFFYGPSSSSTGERRVDNFVVDKDADTYPLLP